MRSEWKRYKVSDLGKVVTGKTPKTANAEYYGGNIPFLTPSDDMSVKYVLSTTKTITEVGKNTVKNSIIPKNSICVSCIGSDLGKVVITTKETVTNQQINSVVLNTELFDVDFVYYAMVILGKVLNYHSKTSTAVPIVNKSTFSQYEVLCPKLSEQKRIAKILSDIDDKIAINTSINENLEQQAQALFKSWFVDFEPFGGVMPDDWSMGTISELSSEIICGKTPSTKKKEYYGDYMPFITIPDMHNSVYVTATERYLSELGTGSQTKKTLPANSICVSCIGTAGLVSLTAVDSQTNQQINSIIPKKGHSPYYIFLLMQTFSEKINRLGQSGSTIVNLNKFQFGMMEALIPSIEAMTDFDNIAKPLFEQILANRYENQRLAALRDTLLPKLMKGEIDVSAVKI